MLGRWRNRCCCTAARIITLHFVSSDIIRVLLRAHNLCLIHRFDRKFHRLRHVRTWFFRLHSILLVDPIKRRRRLRRGCHTCWIIFSILQKIGPLVVILIRFQVHRIGLIIVFSILIWVPIHSLLIIILCKLILPSVLTIELNSKLTLLLLLVIGGPLGVIFVGIVVIIVRLLVVILVFTRITIITAILIVTWRFDCITFVLLVLILIIFIMLTILTTTVLVVIWMSLLLMVIGRIIIVITFLRFMIPTAWMSFILTKSIIIILVKSIWLHRWRRTRALVTLTFLFIRILIWWRVLRVGLWHSAIGGLRLAGLVLRVGDFQ